MFGHFRLQTYESSPRGHVGKFDERFYGRKRADHLNAFYKDWQDAEAMAEAYHYEQDELNQAVRIAWAILEKTENTYKEKAMNILDTGILKYLTGDMIKDTRSMAFIADVRMEEIVQGKSKPVLYLKDWRLGIILNAGNTRQLAAAYGMETDAWRNHAVIVYAEQGRWFGQDGWAVRLAIPAVAPAPIEAPANMEAGLAEVWMAPMG